MRWAALVSGWSLQLADADVAPAARGVPPPALVAESAVVVVDFEGDVSAWAEQVGHGVGVGVRRDERGHVALGDLEVVDPARDHRLLADDADREVVPAAPAPHAEELVECGGMGEHVAFAAMERFEAGAWASGPRPIASPLSS